MCGLRVWDSCEPHHHHPTKNQVPIDRAPDTRKAHATNNTYRYSQQHEDSFPMVDTGVCLGSQYRCLYGSNVRFVNTKNITSHHIPYKAVHT